MEVLFSAVLGELAARCISFLVSKYWATPGLSEEESLRRLEWALLRVAVTVEEAEERFITNAAMLRQLHLLREEMHKGYYLLDRFLYLNRRGDSRRKVNHLHHNRSLAMSSASINPGKHSSPSARPSSSRQGAKELKLMLDRVLNVVADMHEFVAFLKGYPRMCRQPYSMHLLFEKCMFGRHSEMERTVHFLLQREPPGGCNLGVLPIIGQGKVGKTTFVEHVCYDVRVRDHFSQIVFFSENNNEPRTDRLSTFKDGGIIKHKNDTLNEEKILVIVELDGEYDIDDAAWRSLFSAARSLLPSGSKIIITGRSEKLIDFGTTQALRLNFLSREACWYFFKVLVFGSTYPQDHHTELASIAMKIFEEYYSHTDMYRDFIGPFSNSKNIAGILRAKFSNEHWRNILACVKINGQRNLRPYCTDDAQNIRMENEHYYVCRLSNVSQFLQVDKQHRIASYREQAPKITVDQVMYGSVTPKGKFEVVWWKSHLPPYYSYIASCEILDSECTQMRKRFSKKRKIIN